MQFNFFHFITIKSISWRRKEGNKEPDLVKLNQCLNENDLQTLKQIMLGENSDYSMMDYVRQELQNDMKSLVKKK